MPIPTLDEFILLSRALEAAAGQNEDAVAGLRGARASLGWNVLGNLLDLGKIAFAPASPAVLRLVDSLLASHELLAECALCFASRLLACGVVLGSLAGLGKIAFAPASPAVLRLVDSLLASHELLAKCALSFASRLLACGEPGRPGQDVSALTSPAVLHLVSSLLASHVRLAECAPGWACRHVQAVSMNQQEASSGLAWGATQCALQLAVQGLYLHDMMHVLLVLDPHRGSCSEACVCSHFYGVFASESAAEAYATSGEESLWALVAFNGDPTPSAAGAALCGLQHTASTASALAGHLLACLMAH